MSYQSAAAVAATSPYDSTSSGKNRSTSARNFVRSDLLVVAHQPASSFRACCAARSWPPRRIATSALDGIAHRPSSSLPRLLPLHRSEERRVGKDGRSPWGSGRGNRYDKGQDEKGAMAPTGV